MSEIMCGGRTLVWNMCHSDDFGQGHEKSKGANFPVHKVFFRLLIGIDCTHVKSFCSKIPQQNLIGTSFNHGLLTLKKIATNKILL